MDEVAAFGRPVRLLRAAGPARPTPRPRSTASSQVLTKQGMLHFDPRSADLCARPAPRPSGPCRVADLGAGTRGAAACGCTLRSGGRGPSTSAQLDGAQVHLRRQAQRPPAGSRCIRPPARSARPICTGVGKAMIAFLPEEELAAVIAQQSFHRFTDHTYTTEAALRAETAGDPRPRLRLRPRGTRAGDHLHSRITILDPRRPGSGGDVGHLLDGAHDAERIGRGGPSAAHSCRGRGNRGGGAGLALSGCRGITGGRGAMSGLEFATGDQALRRHAGDPRGRPEHRGRGEFCCLRRPRAAGKFHPPAHWSAGLDDTPRAASPSVGATVTRLDPAERGGRLAMVFQSYALVRLNHGRSRKQWAFGLEDDGPSKASIQGQRSTRPPRPEAGRLPLTRKPKRCRCGPARASPSVAPSLRCGPRCSLFDEPLSEPRWPSCASRCASEIAACPSEIRATMILRSPYDHGRDG